MDYKLLGKILVAQSILLFCIFVVLWLLNPNGIDPLFWMILVLVFSLLSYRRQTKAAKHLGITQDHPAYQQKSFVTQVSSAHSPRELTELITGSTDYLGEVRLDGEIILKHAWKGVANMCSTVITPQSEGRETVYKISTEPYWKYAIVDGYSGYRVHEVIKVLLKS